MPSWKDIPGVFSVEVESVNSVLCEVDGEEIPPLYGIVLPYDNAELIIDFKSSGYYRPMSMYGGSDRLGWPAEGSDDRELVRAYLISDGQQVELSEDIQRKLFEHFEHRINEVELEWGERDE